MTVVYLDLPSGRHVAFTKGAPESVISICSHDRYGVNLSQDRKEQIMMQLQSFAEEGLVESPLISLTVRECWHLQLDGWSGSVWGDKIPKKR
jgi:hypothetical protein